MPCATVSAAYPDAELSMSPELASLVLLAPLLLGVVALWPAPPSTRRPMVMLGLSRLATLAALLLAVLAAIVTATHGAMSSPLKQLYGGRRSAELRPSRSL